MWCSSTVDALGLAWNPLDNRALHVLILNPLDNQGLHVHTIESSLLVCMVHMLHGWVFLNRGSFNVWPGEGFGRGSLLED